MKIANGSNRFTAKVKEFDVYVGGGFSDMSGCGGSEGSIKASCRAIAVGRMKQAGWVDAEYMVGSVATKLEPETYESPMTYLVVTVDAGVIEKSLKSSSQIIGMIDMSDCYAPDKMLVFSFDKDGGPVLLTMHHPWHDMKDPLYIKATFPDGSIAFDGYGTDH